MTGRALSPLAIAIVAAVAVGALAVLGPKAIEWILGNPTEAGGAGLLGTAATVEAVRRRSRKRREQHQAETRAQAAVVAEVAERSAGRAADASKDPGPTAEARAPPATDEERAERLKALGSWDD